jgi:hypothetical protein
MYQTTGYPRLERSGIQCYKVTLKLQHTPSIIANLARKLVFILCLHQSAVGQKDVFVTRYHPNVKSRASFSAEPAYTLSVDT